MQTLARVVERINQSSQETAQIIKTIDEIAFQTNLSACAESAKEFFALS